MFSFQYSYLLFLLILLPILVAIFFYALQKKKKALKKIGDEKLVRELTKHYNPASYFTKFILVFLSMALILLSIADLRSPKGSEKVSRNGIDIMIAIDVSKSMLAQDVKPNRLERAKQLLNKLIDKLSNDRIGIIVFAGRAYLQMPLTSDHTATKMYLAAATPETVPTQGTVIADALKSCNASFNAKDKKYKAVVLISDGEDHDENAISIAEKMAQDGVVVNTVGIGSTEGVQIIDELTGTSKVDKDGNIVITKLNEEILSEIAKKGNGSYQLYTNADEIATNLFKELSGLDKRSVTDESLINYKNWFQYLLGLAFLLLIVELFVSEIKRKQNPVMKVTIAIIALFFSLPSFAQNEKAKIKKANDAYKKNEFDKSADQYAAILEKDNKNTVAQYNMGNALYKSKKKQDAINAYDKAASNMTKPLEKSNALYNKAVVQNADNKLKESIASYKDALKLDPTNTDARHNLQLAIKQQQEQQKKEEKKDSKKDKEKEKKEEKNQKEKKEKEEQNEPQQNKSNISKKEAEQKLQALLQNEKKLQDKYHKANAATPNKQDKDW
jgi:tetratricopeptide (TPR) repeat protein